MVRLFTPESTAPKGHLAIRDIGPHCVEIFYVPEEKELSQAGLDPKDVSAYQTRLLRVNDLDNLITIYPMKTRVGILQEILNPKYKKVVRITLAEFDFTLPVDTDDILGLLESLPLGFIKDYDYGLGLQKDYRFIVDAIEELSDCTEIMIAEGISTGIGADPTIFNISYEDFEDARKSINRIARLVQDAAQSVKRTKTFNLFASLTGEVEKSIAIGKHPITRIVTRAAQGYELLNEADQEAVLDAVFQNTKAIADTKPEKLAKLHDEIELVALDSLIERYTVMLSQDLKESRWQSFFNENPFILSLAFGYPIIKVNDQASIGGRKLSGEGEKITDFLAKNSLTNNTALFEIKTPQTALLNKKSYRGGVFIPSRELSGSINQVLDQKYQFQKDVARIKENSRIYDIESYAVHSCLIIGQTPKGTDEQKSFELFRRNSKDVQIVTFDELLEKLKQLHSFLETKAVSD